jgi:hypothetical protein
LPTALSAAFYLLHIAVGNGDMNKFGICFQWHIQHFKARMLFFSVGNGAMNTPRYTQLHGDETSANTPHLSNTSARKVMTIRILIANGCMYEVMLNL